MHHIATIEIPREPLRAMTHIAAAQDVRYYLCGVMLEIGTQECRLVATDGHILAVYRLHGDKDSKSVDLSHELAQQLAENGSLQVIIPIEEVKAIKKQRTYANLILKIEPEQRKFPNDDRNNEMVRFGSLMDPSGRGSETRFKFIDGKFPDFRRVLPRKIEATELKPTYFSWPVMQALMKANVELGAKTIPMPVITQCGSAGLVRFSDPNMIGVAMPYRTDEPLLEAPEWSYGSTSYTVESEVQPQHIYVHHEDPGHGWLEVSRAELIDLGIEREISGYSYQIGGLCFLEEDCDAPKFVEAWEKRHRRRPKIKSVYEDPCPIRNYAKFEPTSGERIAVKDAHNWGRRAA